MSIIRGPSHGLAAMRECIGEARACFRFRRMRWPWQQPLAVSMVVAFTMTPAFAQVMRPSPGHTVFIDSTTATYTGSACYFANVTGSVLESNGHAIRLNISGADDAYGARTQSGGTINLRNGGTIDIGDRSFGLYAMSDAPGESRINAAGLAFSTSSTTRDANFAYAYGASSHVTLSGATTFAANGFAHAAVLANHGGRIVVDGPVQGSGAYIGFAGAVSGGRIDFNAGGNVHVTGGTYQVFAGHNGMLTMRGMNATAATDALDTSIFKVGSASTIVAVNSTFTGTNIGGNLNGIAFTGPGNNAVTLDNSAITLNSPGHGIWVAGGSNVVTMRNAAITPFGQGAASLALVSNEGGHVARLTINAVNAALSGNVLVDGAGTAGGNGFVANLDGATQWTGNVAVLDGSTADVVLRGTARWSGAAANASNVNVGLGTIWTITADSSVSGIVNNAGVMDFGTSGPFRTLMVGGGYVGNGGVINMSAQLGGDNSPADRLVLDGAAASGSTIINIRNRGGAGGVTGDVGIPIVVATNGATTTSSAFRLGAPVIVGAHQYWLFRGPEESGSEDQQNSWFLRTQFPDGTPIFRPEGAMYAAMPSLGRELMRSSIGTFHDYNGDAALLRNDGGSGRGWGRVFGEAIAQKHGGLLSPSFKGRAYGFQSGVDLWQSETPDGFRDRFGVFFSYARASGDVNGFALGGLNTAVGNVGLDSLGGGAYWTRMTPTDGYIEARFIGTHYSGDGTSSVNRMNIDVSGKSFAGSLEAGQPFRFGNGLTIEPQAQVIYQYLDMNGRDPFATLNYDTPNALYARAGLRMSSDSFLGFSNVRPYLKANIWQDVVGTDTVAFSAVDVVDTNFRATALEVGGGIVAQLTPSAAIWGMVDYTADIAGSQQRQIIRGNAGMKLTW